MSRRNKIGLALLLILIGGVVAVLSVNLVREPKQVWRDESQLYQTTHGRLYALQQFLTKLQADVPQQRWRRWDGERSILADSRNTLLFLEKTEGATRADYDSLLAWVAQGNHVVMPLQYGASGDAEADALQATEDAAADEAGVLSRTAYQTLLAETWGVGIRRAKPMPKQQRQQLPLPAACREAEDARIAAQRAGGLGETDAEDADNNRRWCAHYLNRIRLPEGTELNWLLQWNTELYALKPDAVLWQGQGIAGSRIMRLAHGQGSVILVPDIQPLGNPQMPYQEGVNLKQFDHAYLAAYLAQGKDELWFIRDLAAAEPLDSTPAWWRLWRAEPVLMGALLVLLVLGVWHLAVRMGALRQLPVSQERYLQTHLRAQGLFLQHHGSPQQQLWPLQQALWQQWQQQWPQWPTLDDAARVRLLARHLRLPPSVLGLWVAPLPADLNQSQLRAYLQAHQRILQARKAA